jgi:hypothetical protein
MLTLFKTKFKVRILYKSGNSHEVWMTKLNYNKSGIETKITWEAAYRSHGPVLFAPNLNDDIEAIWQVGMRLNVFTALSMKCKELFGKPQ